MPRYRCENCGFEESLDKNLYFCPRCGDPLTIVYDEKELSSAKFEGRGVWRYRDVLPVSHERAVTMNEGGTPLQRSVRLVRELGIRDLRIKNEGLNPSGSFKDRGMTVGVTRALEINARSVICASTGNTAASLSAYAARAGLRAYVVVPHESVALGKLAQARAAGAKIVRIRGNFDYALKLVRQLAAETSETYLLNSVNPFRIEGQKTLAYEIVEEYGVPDWIFIPVGNAGNITALWKGLKELRAMGMIDRMPRLAGVQAEGASPIYRAFISGSDRIEPEPNPQTVATAIKIGSPASWRRALRAVRESNGVMLAVSDEDITTYQRKLASMEGIFVEPASAASVAGLARAVERGIVGRDESAVAVVTGNGLKDPDSLMRLQSDEVVVEASLEALRAVILG
ncbi:MAG: threonine synthase [Nitrososphaeria archaeon]